MRALRWSPRVRIDGVDYIASVTDPAGGARRSKLAAALGTDDLVVVRYTEAAGVAPGLLARALRVLAACRLETLVASLLPLLLGLRIGGPAPFSLALAVVVGVVLLHSAANLLSEAHERAEITVPGARTGGGREAAAALPAPRALVRCAVVMALVGVAVWHAAAIAHQRWELVALCALGALAAWQYVAPPLRMKWRRLGDLALYAIFGPVLAAVGGSLGGGPAHPAWLAAGLIGALAGAVQRHLRDLARLPDDAVVGRRSLVRSIGFESAKRALLGYCWLLSLLPVGAWWIGWARPGAAWVAVFAIAFTACYVPVLRCAFPLAFRFGGVRARLSLLLWMYGVTLLATW